MMHMPFVLLVIFIVGLFSGCASVNQPLGPSQYLRRDITLEHAGKSYEGVAVLPVAASFALMLRPKSNADLLVIKSCHRDVVIEKASSGGLFKKNQVEYLYAPVAPIETEGVCPLRVDALESGSNQYSGFLLDFQDAKLALPFSTQCNGEAIPFLGVGVCQARIGTTQTLYSPSPIRFAPPMPERCPMPRLVSGRYEFVVVAGECLYAMESQEKKLGRLTMVGYENIVLRKVN